MNSPALTHSRDLTTMTKSRPRPILADLITHGHQCMSSLNLSRLRYFVTVADTLNFRQASEILNVAQPAISRSIQMLETDLGFKLLDRTTRRVNLTVAGAALADDAREALQLLERSVRHSRRLASGQAGEVILAYSAQAAQGPMADLVVEFRHSHPGTAVSLYQMSSDEQSKALKAGQIDLGLMLSAACDASMNHLLVCHEPFVALVPESHPLARRDAIALRELQGLDFVAGTPKRWSTFLSLLNEVCQGAGFLPTVVEEASDVPVLIRLIAQGRGVTLYGASITTMLPPGVVAVPISDRHAFFDIGVVWDNKHISPLAGEFVAFLNTMVGAQRAADCP
ncbi:LysR family transcriptional regulator [Alcanivorax sp. N3-2A]|nr:LysR family transcriptional regulator [Alcanivorax sp. N3-2A]